MFGSLQNTGLALIEEKTTRNRNVVPGIFPRDKCAASRDISHSSGPSPCEFADGMMDRRDGFLVPDAHP